MAQRPQQQTQPAILNQGKKMRYSFTRVSGNVKTGPIPVTMTARASCPDSCALKSSGCYAESGNVRMHWQRLDDSSKGYNIEELAAHIRTIPRNSLWRHNVAGDLTHNGRDIDGAALAWIVAANKGRRGFTYTHAHDTAANRLCIQQANNEGFTINLSANSPEHADELAALNIGPVVTLVDIDAPTHSTTPEGRPIITCPATRSDNINCATCGLCAVSTRRSIVGFPVHGSSKKKASAVIRLYTAKEDASTV